MASSLRNILSPLLLDSQDPRDTGLVLREHEPFNPRLRPAESFSAA